MKRRIILDKPGLLIGEGKDEVTFFEAWLGELGLDDRVQVLEYEGKDKLRSFLTVLRERGGIHRTPLPRRTKRGRKFGSQQKTRPTSGSGMPRCKGGGVRGVR